MYARIGDMRNETKKAQTQRKRKQTHPENETGENYQKEFKAGMHQSFTLCNDSEVGFEGQIRHKPVHLITVIILQQ